MSVRKRELPSGQTRWLVDYRDGGGKRRFRQFPTKDKAVQFSQETGVAVRAGVHIADSQSTTVKRASELWLDRCRLDGLEPGTLRNYEMHIRLHILPLIGKMKLSKLTRPVVEQFKDRLLATCTRIMAQKVMVSLKSLLSDAMRRGLVAQNTATGTTVKLAARHEEKVVIPTKDEIRAMLSMTGELWAANEPWRPFVITALFTGLRPSELRGLTWEHVDFGNKVIHVRQRSDYRNKMGSPKSKAGTRDVPLAPMVINTLKEWKLACPKTEAGLVFPAKNGGVIAIAEPHRVWNRLLQALDMPRLKYRFYDLRHVAASLFIEQGWQPKKIMAVMGHASITLTFNTYGHLWQTAEDDAAAMAQIEARLLR